MATAASFVVAALASVHVVIRVDRKPGIVGCYPGYFFYKP